MFKKICEKSTPGSLMVGAYCSGQKGPLGERWEETEFRRMLTRAEVGGDGFIQLIHCHNTYKRVVPGCNEVTEDGNDCTATLAIYF